MDAGPQPNSRRADAAEPSRFRALIDVLVIAIPLVALNILVFRGDPGWLQTNPTPYLLIPLLVGARYGFAWGICAGLLAAAISGGIHRLTLGDDGNELLPIFLSHRFTFASFILLGGMAGLVGAWLVARVERSLDDLDDLRTRAENAEVRAEVYAESSAEMERRLAFHGIDFAGLGEELGRVAREVPMRRPHVALEVMRKLCGVLSGGIYRRGEGGSFDLVASLGDDPSLPALISSRMDPLVEAAVEGLEMSSQPGLWKTPAQREEGVLVVAPLGVGERGATEELLVVSDMDYLAASKANFLRLRLLCRWLGVLRLCGEAIVPGREAATPGDRLVSSGEFFEAIELAQSTAREESRPSTVATLSLPGVAEVERELILRKLWNHLGQGGLATLLEGHPLRVGLLYPARAGTDCERETRGLAGDCVTAFSLSEPPKVELVDIDGRESAENIWGHLNDEL